MTISTHPENGERIPRLRPGGQTGFYLISEVVCNQTRDPKPRAPQRRCFESCLRQTIFGGDLDYTYTLCRRRGGVKEELVRQIAVQAGRPARPPAPHPACNPRPSPRRSNSGIPGLRSARPSSRRWRGAHGHQARKVRPRHVHPTHAHHPLSRRDATAQYHAQGQPRHRSLPAHGETQR